MAASAPTGSASVRTSDLSEIDQRCHGTHQAEQTERAEPVDHMSSDREHQDDEPAALGQGLDVRELSSRTPDTVDQRKRLGSKQCETDDQRQTILDCEQVGHQIRLSGPPGRHDRTGPLPQE